LAQTNQSSLKGSLPLLDSDREGGISHRDHILPFRRDNFQRLAQASAEPPASRLELHPVEFVFCYWGNFDRLGQKLPAHVTKMGFLLSPEISRYAA